MSARFHSDALMEAAVHEISSDHWSLVSATDYVPAKGEREAFCPHCLEKGYLTRIQRRAAQRVHNPSGRNGGRPGRGLVSLDRYTLLSGEKHLCDHPVRSRAFRTLAHQYGMMRASKTDIHAYDFPADVSAFSVDRLLELTKALFDDADLRARQIVTINGVTKPFNDAVFCFSDTRQIYERALARAQEGNRNDDYIGMIFRHIGHQGITQNSIYKNHNIIPGMAVPHNKTVFYEGTELYPSIILTCKNSDVYWAVRKLIDTDTRASIPLFVFGKAALDLDRQDDRVRRIRAGEDLQHGAYVRLSIDDIGQVLVWPKNETEFVREIPVPDRRLMDIAAAIK